MNMPILKIFLVDDDTVFLKLLKLELSQYENYVVETYPTGELCIENLFKKPDIIVLDYHLSSTEKLVMTGIETLNQIKETDADILVIMLSSQDKMEVALDCMQHRAFDYITKNTTTYSRLPQIISNILNFKNNVLN